MSDHDGKEIDLITVKDVRNGKMVTREYLNRRQVYTDAYGNIVMKADTNHVILLSEAVLWDIEDQYDIDDEFTEVRAELVIS